MATETKTTTSTAHTNYAQQDAWLFAILTFLLIFSPIFRGGNRPLALLVIEVAAIGLITALLWTPRRLRHIPLLIKLVAFLSLVSIAAMLIPVPESTWLSISGREIYAEALRLVGSDSSSWRTISVVPASTVDAWFRMLLVVSVFLAVYHLSEIHIQRLVYFVIFVAGFEAVLGLLQRGGGPDSILRFDSIGHVQDAIGTYANRDHLAGFLAMVNPVVLGLLVAELGHDRGKDGKRSNSRKARRGEFFASLKGQRAVFMGLVSLLLLLAIIFTRSRAGIALAMLGLMVTAFAVVRRLGGDNVYGAVGSLIVVLVVLVAEIGLMPVLDRFSADPMKDARWTLYATTIDGIGRFFPFGSGAGTFPLVYPPFQPVELGGRLVNHVHNDFLEAIFEQGIVAIVLIFVALVLYAGQWKVVLAQKDRWGVFRFIQIGAGIGVLMLLLHSLVDFNLQIPANAIFFAFFAGVFFKKYDEVGLRSRKHRRHRHRSSSEPTADGEGETAAIAADIKPDKPGAAVARTWEDFGDMDNPFKDDHVP